MKKVWMVCLLILLAALPGLVLAEGEAIAENSRLRLYLTQDLAGFSVEDKENGMIWSSSMNDETFTGKVNALWEKKMNSLLMINYTNLRQGLGVINNMALLADKQLSASWEPIEQGALLHYDLGASQISLDVEIRLEEDGFSVRVPYAGIREYGEFSLVSMGLLPFLCSASDQAEGYFFYPDGSGALMMFQDNAHVNESTQLYSLYGSLERESSLLDFFAQEEPQAMLPVFGMRRGGHALLAIIEQGDETARISLNCSNKIMKINYLFANLQYRRGFDDRRVTNRSIKIYDNQAMETDYALRIVLLPDEQADYSGMACAYRDYLLETGTLSRRETTGAMALDLFLMAPEDGLLFDTPRTVTTLAQAEKMLGEMYQAGLRNLQVTLKGWSRSGYGNAPDRFPLNRAVGSEKALQSLTEKARALGYTLSLSANLLEAKSTQGGYSKRNDVVYLSNYTILTDEKETTFILSPDVTAEKADALADKAAGLALSGLRFERLGEMLGYNYFSRREISTAECRTLYQRMLGGAREKGLSSLSAQGGAAWLLPYVDQVTEIPYADHGFQFTSQSVPFYQMALHGLVGYTAKPGNLSSDLERETLRWVEMGYTPYFELTYESTEELMYTEYKSLFSAQYTAWLEKLAQIAREFQEGPLAQIQGALMIRHDKVGPQAFRVFYDNGCAVYVNYASEAVTVDGHEIPGMGYLAVKEEGQ